jgi:hypothetical protein
MIYFFKILTTAMNSKKHLLPIFCLFWIQLSFSQPQLSEIDTVLDYKSRFFRNDTLLATNEYLYWDSIQKKYVYEIPEYYQKPRHPYFETVNHGLWVFYWDKKWRECDKSDAAYYQLFEYNYDTFIGKAYTFNSKNELLHSIEPYPIFENEVFNGYLKLSYQNGVVYSAEYRRWVDESLRFQYLNETYYYPNGGVISHTLHDNINKRYRMMSFDDDGFCRVDYKNDETDWYNIQRKRTKKHLKQIELIKNVNGDKIEIYSKDGVEIKRGAPKNRRFSIGSRWWFW